MIVKTPSRLHMGIIDLSRTFLRQYGALGMTIKGGFTIEVMQKGDELQLQARDRDIQQIRKVHKRLKKELDIPSGFKVNIKEDIERHVGLGSTTQLSLGTAAAMVKSAGIDLSVEEIALTIGRARYSAIGTYGFKKGGFILEGGKIEEDDLPPLSLRSAVPDHWRFVIVCSQDLEGYDEKEERPIMENLEVDSKFPAKISHHIVMGLLPALKTGDIQEFGSHLTKIQKLVGRSFSQHQGGIFHPAVSGVIKKLKKLTYGVGQSSWGPTVYGLTTKDKAAKVKNKMSAKLDQEKYRIRVAQPDNRGARFLKK